VIGSEGRTVVIGRSGSCRGKRLTTKHPENTLPG